MALQIIEVRQPELSPEDRFERTLADVIRRIRTRPQPDGSKLIRSTGR